MKNKLMNLFLCFVIFLAIVVCLGCKTTNSQKMRKDIYVDMKREAEWIIRGEPIEFEGDRWYPFDGIEGLLETEIYPVGEHKGVKFFVDKVDVRPYNRLYTRFDKNKYRFFRKIVEE